MVEIQFEKVPDHVIMSINSIYKYVEWSWFEDSGSTQIAHFFTDRDEAVSFAAKRNKSYAFAD